MYLTLVSLNVPNHVYGQSYAADTSRVLALIDSSKKYLRIEPNRSREFIFESLELSKKIAYQRGIAYSYNYYGGVEFHQGEISNALVLFNKADSIFSIIKDSSGLSKVYSNRGIVYNESENYDLAFEDYLKAIAINEKRGDLKLLESNYHVLGAIYFRQEQFDKAWKYFYKSFEIDSILKDSSSMAISLGGLGGVHLYRSEYDKAEEYFMKSYNISVGVNDVVGIVQSLSHLGVLYEKKGMYDQSRSFYDQIIPLATAYNLQGDIGSCYGNIGVTYYREGRFKEAVEWSLKEMKQFEKLKDTVALKNVYRKLSDMYSELNQFEEAYHYFLKHETIADILKEREKGRLLKNMAFKNELYNKDKELELLAQSNNIKQLEIEKKNFYLYGSILLFALLLIMVIIVSKFHHQKVKANYLDLQQQFFRSQVNPHFIFNVFNSIQSYFIQKQYKEGETYLRKFATLVRKFLEKSENTYTTLSEEIEHMKLYLEIEQLRLKKKMDFELNVDPEIDIHNCLIPSFIAQSYLENAVWHGIADMESDAKIKVDIIKQEQMLLMSIIDNGVGIEHTRKLKLTADQAHQSKGMKITLNRIQHLNKRGSGKFAVKVVDLKNEHNTLNGTKVEIQLPITY